MTVMAYGRHRRTRRTEHVSMRRRPRAYHVKFAKSRKSRSTSAQGSWSRPTIQRLVMANVAPDSLLVKLRYPQVQTQALAVTGFNSFRGNGAFDPDSTGGGQQPGGFDQWSGLYSHYRVLASSIELNIVNEAAVATQVTVFPTLSNVTPTTYQNSTVIPYKKQILLSGKGGRDNAFIKNYITTSKIVGLSSMAINAEDDFQVLISANPANQWFWGIFSSSLDGTTDINIDYTVNVTYYIRFEDRVQVAIS